MKIVSVEFYTFKDTYWNKSGIFGMLTNSIFLIVAYQWQGPQEAKVPWQTATYCPCCQSSPDCLGVFWTVQRGGICPGGAYIKRWTSVLLLSNYCVRYKLMKGLYYPVILWQCITPFRLLHTAAKAEKTSWEGFARNTFIVNKSTCQKWMNAFFHVTKFQRKLGAFMERYKKLQ